MNPNQHIIDQWAEGNVAPFDLYNGTDFLLDQPVLVENTVGTPIIRQGDLIPAGIAARVAAHHTLASADKVVVYVVTGVDADGNAITEATEVDPVLPRIPFTYIPPALAHEDDMQCDMCGEWRDELFTVGPGWYCKVPRVNAEKETDTCFNFRITQLGGIQS